MLQRTVLNLKSVAQRYSGEFRRGLSVLHKEKPDYRMLAWQIHSYGGIDELQLSKTRIPELLNPTDVLIKVEASSVNPIDIAMSKAYGATLINLARWAADPLSSRHESSELPLILGRDFSGQVISKGHSVHNLQIGDKVWGVIPVHEKGCHAEYISTRKNMVRLQPKNLSHIEAASILYTSITAWNSLWLVGGLCYKVTLPTRRNRRVLVLGGSGGVGTCAIQMLKAWNMPVITTCSTDAVEMVQDLGADVVIDYKSATAVREIICEGPYDIILDCANEGLESVRSKGYPHQTYISLNSPLLKNMDDHGAITGSILNVSQLIRYSILDCSKGNVRWSFMIPTEKSINAIQTLVENGQLKPVIQEVFKFKDLPAAYAKLAAGHARGKIVIDFQ